MYEYYNFNICVPLGSIIFTRCVKYRDYIIPAFTQTSVRRVPVQGYRRVELSARDRQKYKAVRAVRGIQLLRDRYRYPHRFHWLTARDRTIRPEN